MTGSGAWRWPRSSALIVASGLLSPASLAVVALSGLLALALSGTSGVAAYGFGTTFTAIVAILAAGGSTLAYASGTPATRGAVLHVRYRVVTPVLLVMSVVVGAVAYATIGPDAARPALLGGLTVCFTNLAELENYDYHRRLAVSRHASVLSLTRSASVPFAVLTHDFPVAMTSAAVLSWVVLAALRPGRTDVDPHSGLRRGFRAALDPHLMLYSSLELVALRWPLAGSAFLMVGAAADDFGAMMTAALSISGLVLSLFSVSMAGRGGGRVNHSALLERLGLVVTVFGTTALVALAPVFLGLIVDAPSDALLSAFRVVLAAVLVRGLVRFLQYRWMGQRDHRSAAVVLVPAAGPAALLPLLASSGLGPDQLGILIASLILAGEMMSLAMALVRRRRANRRGDLHR